jgi:hypothetical protein
MRCYCYKDVARRFLLPDAQLRLSSSTFVLKQPFDILNTHLNRCIPAAALGRRSFYHRQHVSVIPHTLAIAQHTFHS